MTNQLTTESSYLTSSQTPILLSIADIKGIDESAVPKAPTTSSDSIPPILVGSDGYLIDGHHRIAGLKEGGQEKVWAIVTDEYLPKSGVSNQSLTVNPFVSEAQRRACYAADDPDWDCEEWERHTPKKKLPSRKRKKVTTNLSISARKRQKQERVTRSKRPTSKNPLRIDPTRTITLRRQFATELRKRFMRLKGLIVKLVDAEDAFGLARPSGSFADTLTLGLREQSHDPFAANIFCPTGAGGGIDPSCSPRDDVGITRELRDPDEKPEFDELHRMVVVRLYGEAIGEYRLMNRDDGNYAIAFIRAYKKMVGHGQLLYKEAYKEAVKNAKKLFVSTDVTKDAARIHEKFKKAGILADNGQLVFPPEDITLSGIGIQNSFCPTGVGGGVDPSCSPSASEPSAASQVGILGKLKQLGADAGHLEHSVSFYVKDKVAASVAKLPPKAQTVVKFTYHALRVGVKSLFVTWQAKQALAERISRAKGSTHEEAKKLRGLLSSIDLNTFEVFKFSALFGIHAAHIPAAITGSLPVATTAYLAYSTARHPIATARAAGGLIKDAVLASGRGIRGVAHAGARRLAGVLSNESGELTTNSPEDSANLLANRLETHDYDDWYIALFCTALDQVEDVYEALALADLVYKKYPEDASEPAEDDEEAVFRESLNLVSSLIQNVFCATGEGGGVDPSCSSNPEHLSKSKRDESGNWTKTLGMPKGKHTPEGQKRIIEHLTKETGLQFRAHGSVSQGETSDNDMDIIEVPPNREESERLYQDQLIAEGKIVESYQLGEISHDEMMQQLYGSGPDDNEPNNIDKAMLKLGFKPAKLMLFGPIVVTRYHNAESSHTVEIWSEGDPDAAPGDSSTWKSIELSVNDGGSKRHNVSDEKSDRGSSWTTSGLAKSKYCNWVKSDSKIEEGKPVLLRVKRVAAKFRKESTGDFYATKKIPVEHIEALDHEGRWVPLQSSKSVENVFCATGKGGGIDSSCGRSGEKIHSVITETNHNDAEILLTQGVRPDFKRERQIGEFAPGAGLERGGVYVGSGTGFSKGSFGKVRLHLKVPESQLDVPAEMKQLGYEKGKEVAGQQSLDYVLGTEHGGVTAGEIPPTAFHMVEVSDGTGWKSMTPKEYLESRGISDTPRLPSMSEYEESLRKNAEEWGLQERHIQKSLTDYNRANLRDKIYLAQEAGLASNSSCFNFSQGNLTDNTRWKFHTDPQKVKAFQDWLKTQFQATLTGQTEEQLWAKYIEAGYKRGVGRAFDDTRSRVAALSVGDQRKLDFYAGSKDEFLRSSFAQPVAKEKLELLVGRSFDDLENVTTDMSARMSRSLADSLVQGENPREAAKALAEEVDMGLTRALTIARTELMRSHAEGQLTALENLGVEEVGVAVEWLSAGDDKVCPKCASLEGVVLKISEARGLLPRHPLCRCAWTPANVGEEDEDQTRSREAIQEAVADSVEDEGGVDESDWAGADLEPDKKRPESILDNREFDEAWNEQIASDPSFDEHLYKLYGEESLPPALLEFSQLLYNAFCPTGAGGGVDPSCSPTTTGKGEVLHAATLVNKQWVGADGKPVPEHIRKLGIPPSWRKVVVNHNSAGDLLAQGIDAKGRTQSKYSDSHDSRAAAAKFGRVRELLQQREGILREMTEDAKNPTLRDRAECARVVLQTGMRPGSDEDMKAADKSYGATTLEGRHVITKEDGSVTALRLVTGKNKGREVEFPIRDPETAAMLQRRAEAVGPNGRLFDTNRKALALYNKSKDGGGFKTKDHRTALGTETAIAAIHARESEPQSPKEYKDAVKEVATKVASTLGNTPRIALKDYIDPLVFSSWRKAAKV